MQVPVHKKIAMGLIALLAISCSTTNSGGLFSKKTPHESYTGKIENAGLQSTTLGRSWLAAAQKGLEQPQTVQLPYQEIFYFPAEQPRSTAYQFAARRGDQINIQFTPNPVNGFLLFADIWQRKADNKLQHLLSADTLLSNLVYEVKEDGNYLLRLQAELLKSGSCTISISSSPSLVFPVPAGNKRSIISVWGDDRDAGARKHEGIDIPGKLRTPLVAIADGYISSVKEDRIGGKVVMLRPTGKNYTLYYAHLDEQLATQGQEVKLGDTIGLMGNTGNASGGSPHLHFGIYTNGGAVNPLPFVDFNRSKILPITTPLQAINGYVSNTKQVNVYAQPSTNSMVIEKLPSGTPLLVMGAADSWYKVLLPNNKQAFIKSSESKLMGKPIKTYRTANATLLLAEPSNATIAKKSIAANTELGFYGSYEGFNLVEVDGLKGWVVSGY